MTIQISHNYTSIPSLLSYPPLPPSILLSHHRAPDWDPCYIATSHQLSIYSWQCIRVDATFSIHPTLSLPNCVHKPTLYICRSIPSLQIGSSVPFFRIPYIYTLLCDIYFSLSDFTLCNRLQGTQTSILHSTLSSAFLATPSLFPLQVNLSLSSHKMLILLKPQF